MFSYLRSAWQLDETERLRQGSDKQNLRSEMRPRVARTLLSAPAQRQPPAHCRLTPLGFLPDSTRRNPPNPRTSVAADTPARACVAAGALACRPAHCRLAPLGFLPDSTRRNPPDPRTSVAATVPTKPGSRLRSTPPAPYSRSAKKSLLTGDYGNTHRDGERAA